MQAPEDNSQVKPEYDAAIPAALVPHDNPHLKPLGTPTVDPATQHHVHADPTADTVNAAISTGQPEPVSHLPQQQVHQPVPDVDVEAVVGDAVVNPLHQQENTVPQESQEPIVQQHHHHTMEQVEPNATHPLGAGDPNHPAEAQPEQPQVSHVQVQMTEIPQGHESGQAPPPSSPVQQPHHDQLQPSNPVQVQLPDSSAALTHGMNMAAVSAGLAPITSAGVPATIATSSTATPVVSSMGVIHSSSTTNVNTTKMMNPNNVNNNNNMNGNMPIPVLAPAPAAPSPHASATVPSLSHGMQIFAPQHNMHTQNHSVQSHHMDLHENTNLLQFSTTTTDDVTMANVGGGIGVNVGQTMNNTYTVNGGGTAGNNQVRVVPSTGDVGLSGSHETRKTQRLPGTKQCPSCSATIAAALAQCNRCGHVFRAKKEKPKRSGKRGKKNCPKCQYENPSACSSCKKCGYVFRLKLMDRYKQMRPRDNGNVIVNGTGNVKVSTNDMANIASNVNVGQNLVNVHPPSGGGLQVVQTTAAAAAAAQNAAVAAAQNANVNVNLGNVGNVSVSSGVMSSTVPGTISGIGIVGGNNGSIGLSSGSVVPPLPTNSTGSLPMPSGVQQYHALPQTVTNNGYSQVAPLSTMPQSTIQVSNGNSTGNINSSGSIPAISNLPMSGTVTSMHHHQMQQATAGHNNPHTGQI